MPTQYGKSKLYPKELRFNDNGDKIHAKMGANACFGKATLTAGAVTVNNTAVTNKSEFILTGTNTATGGNEGHLYPSNRVAGTSFNINSRNAGDDRIIFWVMIDEIT